MHISNDYNNFQIHVFWSKPITTLIDKITHYHGKSYSTQHDLFLDFLNDKLFKGEGKFNKEFRRKGKRYFDLKVPSKNRDIGFEIVELKIHSSQLKYLRRELKNRDDIFSHSDYLYFCYLLQRASKTEGKIIKEKMCIYYLVLIILSRNILTIPINKLVGEIRVGTEDITQKVAKKSEIEEEEELLGVENIIKVVDLERKLKEKDKTIREKDKTIREKDKEIQKLKDQLKNK